MLQPFLLRSQFFEEVTQSCQLPSHDRYPELIPTSSEFYLGLWILYLRYVQKLNVESLPRLTNCQHILKSRMNCEVHKWFSEEKGVKTTLVTRPCGRGLF